MDIAAGPAALGGMMMGVALGAWMLGRWQGGVTAPGGGAKAEARGAAARHDPNIGLHLPAAEASSCQVAARAERNGAMTSLASLGEIHDEMTAYRRAEQVLSAHQQGQGIIAARDDAAQGGCRYLGLTGQPTCGITTDARRPCQGLIRCDRITAPAPAMRVPQPSALPCDLTRL